MQLSLHLSFAGQCEAAFHFYERVLGGKIGTMLTYGNSPMCEQTPVEWRDKIVHANLTFGDSVLSGADTVPEQYQWPQGFYVLLEIDDPVKAEQTFRALAEGGSVQMPIQKTFWSPAFGVLVDRFGVPWEVSCGKSSSPK